MLICRHWFFTRLVINHLANVYGGTQTIKCEIYANISFRWTLYLLMAVNMIFVICALVETAHAFIAITKKYEKSYVYVGNTAVSSKSLYINWCRFIQNFIKHTCFRSQLFEIQTTYKPWPNYGGARRCTCTPCKIIIGTKI